eukprot:CAMPEP_0202875406 /NCGR_PEP_ID=MMETSP1391-20130828/27242_1 /ASSEMBLY_ACC=CAM_ASM_000867 /TAXON_ID=1034604 /ORGANISM="Chlamydomonas leiostraca, Strain SAG 11-49" /LENGTH=76 /DNA_ID=CAMNT_0049557079 /DNA_START=283 /DNA_END=513 /DNA_ORIENTATION=+
MGYRSKGRTATAHKGTGLHMSALLGVTGELSPGASNTAEVRHGWVLVRLGGRAVRALERRGEAVSREGQVESELES